MRTFIFIYLLLILFESVSLFAQNEVKLLHQTDKVNSKQYERYKYFWDKRKYSIDSILNIGKIRQEAINKAKINADNNILWESLGPKYIANDELSWSYGYGRVNCVAFSPNQFGTIFIGTAGTGVWKSTNNGLVWDEIDLSDFAVLGVSDIAISEENANIIYIATGDSKGFTSFGGYSVGLLKSIDGGLTFQNTSYNTNLSAKHIIYKIYLRNENEIYIASSDGLFYSDNAGDSFKLILNDVECVDILELKYGLYIAAKSKSNTYIYKQNGISFDLVRTFNESDGIVIEGDRESRIYALTSRINPAGLNKFEYSDNAGENWSELVINDIIEGQGFYNLALGVSPFNPEIIYAGGINLYYSTNRGKSFQKSANNILHYDNHDIKFNPFTNQVISANDGGVYVSDIAENNWESINWGLELTQYYKFSSSNINPNMIIAGSQDNGTHLWNGKTWKRIAGGDGADGFIYYNKPNEYIFSTTKGFFEHNQRKVKFQNEMFNNEKKPWVSQIAQINSQSNSILLAYQNLFKTTNNGNEWQKLTEFSDSTFITNIEVSSSDSNYIAFSNQNGLFLSTNSGQNWQKISEFSNISSILFYSIIPLEIIFTRSSYDSNSNLNLYTNGKVNDFSHNVTKIPVNDIVIDRFNQNTLYIATDIGVYKYEKEVQNWQYISSNMKACQVEELEINLASGMLRAATFGRGVWQTKLNECFVPKPILDMKGTIEICKGDSIEVNVSNYNQNFKYIWSDGYIGKSRIFRENGEYYVSAIEYFYECANNSDAVNVIIRDSKNAKITTNSKIPVCYGEKIVLYLLDSNKYSNIVWSNNSTGKSIEVSEAGKYYCTAYNNDRCRVYSDTMLISFYEKISPVSIIKHNNYILADTSYYQYRWYLNGKIILDEYSSQLEIKKSGIYFVQAFDTNWCQVISNSIDISLENDEISMNLYTNPISNILEIEFISNSELAGNLEIYDANGNMVQLCEITNGSNYFFFKYNLSHLAKGVYFLRFITNGKQIEKKFIKSNS